MMLLRGLGLLLFAVSFLRAEPLIDFPTDNRNILAGHPQDFFMYVTRDFEGEKSKPWQGGQYGFVRGPVREAGHVVYIHMHEGIDIAPMHRDPAGIPLDEVRAAATGQVVYTNKLAGASNYGRYVVIEHIWDGCAYYTLYAHLSQILVEPGQPIRQGQPLGIMGFTGVGIDKERAHTHFEVCLLMSKEFDSWQKTNFPADPNPHGLYNGLNLYGVDPAGLLLAAAANPNLHISDYISGLEPAFSVTIPFTPNFSLPRNYPWMVPRGSPSSPPAWTITFSKHAVPLKVLPAAQPVAKPEVTWVKDTGGISYLHSTRGMVTGPLGSPRLSDSGLRLMQLLTWPG
ncbi:hypothetical protein BH09VER1_BH09VER1_33280 [soil metagenome]